MTDIKESLPRRARQSKDWGAFFIIFIVGRGFSGKAALLSRRKS